MDPVGYQACALTASMRGGLGAVLTLGRQALFLSHRYRRYAGIPSQVSADGFCESLLINQLGATTCDSMDISPYEGATILHDLNDPLPAQHHAQFDTVLDLGTLEHVFDVRTAFRSVGQACREGGHVVHVLPANQQCGHGLYQFSPEFMFSYYTKENGYDSVSVFLVQVESPATWFDVVPPDGSRRVNVQGITGLYVVCIARKAVGDVGLSVQQSDYAAIWAGAVPRQAVTPRLPSERSPTARAARSFGRRRLIRRSRDAAKRTRSAIRLVTQPVFSDAPLRAVDFADLLSAAAKDP